MTDAGLSAPPDPLAEVRGIVERMTPGEWYESPDGLGASVRAPRAEPLHDTPYVTVANLNDQSLGDLLPDEANAAGIVAGVRLLRALPGAEEALAEKLADLLFDPDRYVGWINLNNYGKAPYRGAARAILAHLAKIAMGGENG